jgi:hypothetical protein
LRTSANASPEEAETARTAKYRRPPLPHNLSIRARSSHRILDFANTSPADLYCRYP